MSKKKKVIIVSVGGALVLLLAQAYFDIHRVRRTTDLQTIQSLVQQHVKIGMSPDEVIQFLDSQKLEHSALWRPDPWISGPHNYSNLLVIHAIKRRTMESFLSYENIELMFVFNDKHELERFDIFPTVIGL
jgi:hypothetical protein